MKKELALTLLIAAWILVADGSRTKRSLIYPPKGSKVQFIIGTGLPIPLEDQSITIGYVLKSAYLLPTNSTEVTNSYVAFQKRSTGQSRATRYDYYRSFEHAAESFRAGGKECMLRAICEASKIPFRASNLAGQILHIFLTPSSTDEPPLSRTDMDYHTAERLGREDTNCTALYSGCLFSVVDLLSVVF